MGRDLARRCRIRRQGRPVSAGRSPAWPKPHAVFPTDRGGRPFAFSVSLGRNDRPERVAEAGEKARGFSCLPGSAGNVRRYEDAVFQKHRGRERRAPFQQKRESAKASSREPAFFLMSEGRRGTTCLPCLLPELCRTRFAVRFGAFPWWAKRGSRAPRLHRGRACRLGDAGQEKVRKARKA